MLYGRGFVGCAAVGGTKGELLQKTSIQEAPALFRSIVNVPLRQQHVYALH